MLEIKNVVGLDESISDVMASFKYLCNEYGELMEEQRMPVATFVKVTNKIAALHIAEISKYLKLRSLFGRKDCKIIKKELLALFKRNHKIISSEYSKEIEEPEELLEPSRAVGFVDNGCEAE